MMRYLVTVVVVIMAVVCLPGCSTDGGTPQPVVTVTVTAKPESKPETGNKGFSDRVVTPGRDATVVTLEGILGNHFEKLVRNPLHLELHTGQWVDVDNAGSILFPDYYIRDVEP
jgi:hypothetical protein